MLQSLDGAASDALQCFFGALAQAQQTLQQDLDRLGSTAQMLQILSDENNELRTGKVHNTQELQRLGALRAEKAKLTRQTQHKQVNMQSCLAHTQHLKGPRLALVDAVEGQRRDVKALQKQYCVRAAQLHAYVAQLLAPQNSLENLRRQLVQMCDQREAGEAAVRQLKQKLEELQMEVTALNTVTQAWATESEEAGSPERRENGEGRAGYPSPHTASESDAGAPRAAVLRDAERMQILTAKRAEQQTTSTARQLQYMQEEAGLQQHRKELKELVLRLCRDIEVADALQQEEQRRFHDALNAAASSGAPRVCMSCSGDLLLDVS
ncbi:hypothetical protein ABL78_3675 [Leptomonas seymouri]|uniref:Uncharacterized protein n=1 Tax=Leptomonas seymouri TaxID=5684 RepID=A0A0N1HXL4_LEPSE|nr:hypothetical protein ABL78_3675 [Leptomonas seymouri]|eukprot:KPI87238.1 hypothetical protein ABL78_3675 [Leptomonas seymouri]